MITVTQCIRCGKERILDKTWSEQIGISLVTYTQSVCPDADCQKIVEALLKDKHDLFVHRTEESLKRRRRNITKSALLRKNIKRIKDSRNALLK